jgi:hypothetical protein
MGVRTPWESQRVLSPAVREVPPIRVKRRNCRVYPVRWHPSPGLAGTNRIKA